jgi:hypothetical protein
MYYFYLVLNIDVDINKQKGNRVNIQEGQKKSPASRNGGVGWIKQGFNRKVRVEAGA